MALEQEKKEDLIKIAREAQQNLKLANARISELEEVIANGEASANEASEQVKAKLNDLPYIAVSTIKVNKNFHRVIQVRFDLNGNAAVDQSAEKTTVEGYRASYEAAKILETIIVKQQESKKEEKKNED